jgi:hypothetical protein
MMEVELVNSGPVTVLLENRKKILCRPFIAGAGIR